MSIDYSFRLCMGFELEAEEVENAFLQREYDPGTFHMEDRFDPKTGVKLEPIKAWDKKPSTKEWVEYKGNQISDLDPEEWEKLLEEEFNCYVHQMGSWCEGDLTYVFSVNVPSSWKDADNYGNITVYQDSIKCADIVSLVGKATQLKEKLEQRGYKVDEPKVFIAAAVS